MTAAISFDGHPPAEETPLGIDVATREFLRAHFRFGSQQTYFCVCPDEAAANLYRSYAAEENISAERCMSINQNDPEALEEAGCLIRYDPGILKYAWARRYHGEHRYSLCGIAHAGASGAVMDMLGQYVTAPLQPWDAVICPSNAIKQAIAAVIEGWEAYLAEKLEAKPTTALELPVIPLGVDTKSMSKRMSSEARKTQRQMLEIGDDEIVLLYVGRLNHIAKSNPISLLLAAEKAAEQCKHQLRIIFNGYYLNEGDRKAFEQGVMALCNNVNVSHVRHGDPQYPNGAWAAGDIFCSLPDNIQESFGLTPVEAMAVGLPVIASDWDGYRESVRNGMDGFLVPTFMPPAGVGDQIAYRYFTGQFTYGDYLGATSQATAIDLSVLTQSIFSLATDNNLRHTFGESGKRRAHEKFEWSRIINTYEELWKELALRRAKENTLLQLPPSAPFHPSRPDPFKLFSGFPSKPLELDGNLSLVVREWPEIHKRIQLKLGLVQAEALINLEDLPGLIGELESHQKTSLRELAGLTGLGETPNFLMTVGWLVKIGICNYESPPR